MHKVNPNYFFSKIYLLFVACFLTFQSFSLEKFNFSTSTEKINLFDTVPLKKKVDTTKYKDSIINKTDTLSFALNSDSLNAPANYKAEDSMALDVASKKIYLYGRSNVKYTEIQLDAPEIIFDQTSQLVTARMVRDTAGLVKGLAKLTQNETVSVSDSIKFNFKSQKGTTHNSYFQQDEIYNFAEKVKKIDVETFYAARGRFTTCNLDTPHFAFRFSKAKFINKKLVVTGPVHPEFEGVPIPVYLPFGIFPLATGRHSGVLPPSLTFNQDFGVGLEGLGYYKVINDYFDAKIWSDIYSYGTYRVNVAPTYRVRYRYNGGLTLSYQNSKYAFKGDPDYNNRQSFFITWNHSMDSKARPGVTFSGNVQAGSSSYLRLLPSGGLSNVGNTSSSQPMSFTNQLQSSIAWSKRWVGKPYSLSVNLNHNQNTQTRIVNLNLPDIGFVVNTIYPFQPKEFVGESKWYEKLGIGYNGAFKSQVSFYDSGFAFKKLIDTMQWGASHDIPIILSLPSLGPLLVSPSFSLRDRMYAQRFLRKWNPNTKKLDTTITKGFYEAREIALGLSFNTALFATFTAKSKDARVQAIRHVMRPSFGFNYRPDMAKAYYYREKVDTSGNQMLFSVFDGSIYGPFSSGRSGGIGFGLDNNIEMKVRSRTDTGENAIKKVKLIDGFGFNGGYNFLADSFKLSPISIYARSTLFEKINITASANLDPYQTDKRGFRKDIYAWQGGKFSPGTITNGNLNISTGFQSKKKEEKKKDEKSEEEDLAINQDQLMQQMDYMRRNPAEFADFNIAWSLNVGINLQFSNQPKPDYSGYQTEYSSSATFNGDFNLTKKWKMGANGYYDLKNLNLQSFTMFVSRDLHCWQMSVNITPVGLYRYFSININPKSSMLRDLKVNRTRFFVN